MPLSTTRRRAGPERADADGSFEGQARQGPGDAMPASDADRLPHGDLWVFGYGSLMWRPGFAYVSRRRAMLRGWRRSLCIYSHVYRGTPEHPGLVLGLDRGGACAGVAFHVLAALREATIRYLREREQATAVYLERMVPVALESGERVSALTYVADRLHRQYAGRLGREAMLTIVRAGRGQSGDNARYVTETHDHLATIGVRDSELEWLSARLRQQEDASGHGASATKVLAPDSVRD
jgi:cation transport protein ChaC